MFFPCVSADDHGHSYISEVGLAESGNAQRMGTTRQSVKYWRAARYLPGHYLEFKAVEDIQFVAVVSGRMELTMSNGDRHYLSRGDMILFRDTVGQGHCTRVLGEDFCEVLIIAMHDLGDFIL